MTVRTVTTCEFSDVLYVAHDLGFDWNTAHEILRDDGVAMFEDGNGSLDYHIQDFQENGGYDYTDDTKKIMLAFFAKHGLNEVTMIAG